MKNLPVCQRPLAAGVILSGILSLAACGGGGGGGDSTVPIAPVTGGTIAGVAAKGILKNAGVTAYCGNSEAAADLLASTTTDTAGAYSLKWTINCTKPLKLIVALATGTTMADEATGKDVTPPAGFKLRALVADPSTTTTKNITPFTDMAAAVAGTASTPTAIANAELAIVNTVLGGDLGAYQAKPVAPTATALASASVDEKKLATLLTAVSAYAQDDATCGAKATDGDKIQCATQALATQAAATVTGVSDTGYTVATTVPAATPAGTIAATLTKITAGTITLATGVSTDITDDTSGASALLTSAEDKVTTAAGSGGTVVIVAGSASGIQAARNLFNSLKTDLAALSNSNGNGFLDQQLSAMQTDFSTNGQLSATGLTDFTQALSRAIEMANAAKSASWTVAVSGTLQGNAVYPTNDPSVFLETDANGAPQAYIRSFFGVNISNQPDNMNCKVLVSNKTAGIAGCYYSAGVANSSVTAGTPYGTFTGYLHALEVSESATASGSYTWQDYLASRSYTTQLYAMPMAPVHLFGNANYVSAAALVATSTKQSGTAVFASDALGNPTSLSIKGNIQPLLAGQDNSTVDLSVALTTTSTTQTAALSGSVSNVKGTATTLTMGLMSGSQIVMTTGSAGHVTAVNFVTQLKTAAFQYDGTFAMDTFTADKAGNYDKPANTSFSGKISSLANASASEFMNGTLSLKLTNIADFDPRLANSATNFLKGTASFSGTVTSGGTAYAVTFVGDGSTYGQESFTLNYTRAGTQVISVTGTRTDATGTAVLTIKGTGDVTVALTDGTGDVTVGTTKVGTVTNHPNQVIFTDGTYLLLSV